MLNFCGLVRPSSEDVSLRKTYSCTSTSGCSHVKLQELHLCSQSQVLWPPGNQHRQESLCIKHISSLVLQGTAGGLAVQFSACTDEQTAADTNQLSGNVSTGAATFSFIQVCLLKQS